MLLKKGDKTKELIKRLATGDYALIKHADIDWVAAESLERKSVGGVINAEPFISGAYPNLGPSYLLKHHIPMWEISETAFYEIPDSSEVTINKTELIVGEKNYCLKAISEKEIEAGLALASENLPLRLSEFANNTLEYAKKEMALLTKELPLDKLKVKMAKKEAVVVVRGKDYREDLRAIRSFIEDRHPVLVGVDGGADALIEMGYRPDIIIGDMDSVSNQALSLGKELLVHAYLDGKAPGTERLKKLGLKGLVIPCEGTSEDLALLILQQLKATVIITVGSHSNMIDFLEKSRKGMASTFLTRLRVGDRLVDAKGLSVIYRARPKNTYALLIILAAFIPLLVLIILSPPIASWLKIVLRQLSF